MYDYGVLRIQTLAITSGAAVPLHPRLSLNILTPLSENLGYPVIKSFVCHNIKQAMLYHIMKLYVMTIIWHPYTFLTPFLMTNKI